MPGIFSGEPSFFAGAAAAAASRRPNLDLWPTGNIARWVAAGSDNIGYPRSRYLKTKKKVRSHRCQAPSPPKGAQTRLRRRQDLAPARREMGLSYVLRSLHLIGQFASRLA
jgi:hypothetical protein